MRSVVRPSVAGAMSVSPRIVHPDPAASVSTGSLTSAPAGAEVRDPVLTLAAGSGWTIRGDTLIAPATEGRTTLRISATRAERTTAAWVHLSGTGATTPVTDSLTVTAGIDLRASAWTASWSCGWDRYGQVPDSNGVTVDSSQYRNVTA